MITLVRLVSLAAVLAVACSSQLRGHMEPLGRHRPGPEDTIDEFNGSLSAETFYREYVQKRRPVVIRRGAVNWPAYKLWTDDYLNKTYGHMELRLEEKVEGESNHHLPAGKFGIGRDSLENFLSGYLKKGSNGYIVGELPAPMYEDVRVLPCMACSSLYNKIQEVNFWLTSKGAASAIHRDAFDAINCLLNGTKEWYFMDSSYSDEVYVIHRGKYELGGLSLINPHAVDLEQHPKFSDVKYAFLTINAGDCLFVPSGYYHQVRSPGGKNMAVSVLFSKTPRNVKLNTCTGDDGDGDDVQATTYKPLTQAGVYLQYPGTGDMTMGRWDIEMFRTVMENFTRANGGKCDESVVVKTVVDVTSPAEGYATPNDMTEDSPEMKVLGRTLFPMLNSGKKAWLSLDDLDAIPVETWKKVIYAIEPNDVSNTYDFEYSIIAAAEIEEAVEDFFRHNTDVTRSDWIHIYTNVVSGSEYIGHKVFDMVDPEKRDRLEEAEFREKMTGVLERYEQDDPRLDVGEDELNLIRGRAEEKSDDDGGDDDDGEEDMPAHEEL